MKRLLGIAELVVTAYHHILTVRKFAGSRLQKGDSVHNRHVHIHKHNIRVKFPHGCQPVPAVYGKPGRFDSVVFPVTQFLNGDLYRFLIVNNQRFVH